MTIPDFFRQLQEVVRHLGWVEVAAAAYAGQVPGETVGLEDTQLFSVSQSSFANGTHAVVLEVDPESRVPHLAFQPNQMTDVSIWPVSEINTSYYLRVYVKNRLGVMADLTRILADARISIDAVLQKEPAEGATRLDIIMLTHQTREKNIDAAIAKMEAMDTVVGKVTRIRLESLS